MFQSFKKILHDERRVLIERVMYSPEWVRSELKQILGTLSIPTNSIDAVTIRSGVLIVYISSSLIKQRCFFQKERIQKELYDRSHGRFTEVQFR